MKISMESVQKLLHFAFGLALVKHDGRPLVYIGTVNPYARFGLFGLSILFKELYHRLMRIQNFSLHESFRHSIPQ